MKINNTKDGFLIKERIKIGFFFSFISQLFRKLFPLCEVIVICKCGSPCQTHSKSKSLPFDKRYFGKVYDTTRVTYHRYECLECGEVRYYKEMRLKHNPFWKRNKNARSQNKPRTKEKKD